MARTVDDTPITDWQQQVAPLAEYAAGAEQLIADIEHPLGALYDQAEQRGDEEAIVHIMAAWGKAQQIAAQIPPFVAALKGAGATVDELRHQRNAIANELNDLMEAVQTFDIQHPALRDFAAVVSEEAVEDAYEMISDEMYEQAAEYFSDAADDQFFSFLMANFDASHIAVGDMISALRGEHDIDERQRLIIQELIDSFKPESLL